MDFAPVPMAIVTGFLGSGKTTLLKRLTERHRQRRIMWIVNEFGALDIDGGMLRARGADVVSVAGGSLFCRCTATTFQRVARQITAEIEGGGLDGVVVEASGISRPSGAERVLREFSLKPRVAVSSVTCIVDPIQFPVLRSTLPCILDQIETCDSVLLNKADTVSPETLDALVSDIARLTSAPVIPCVHCAVDVDVFRWAHPAGALGALEERPDSNFVRFQVETTAPQDTARLGAEITAIGATLYRCKGILCCGAPGEGFALLNWTPSGLDVTALPGGTLQQTGLVLVARRGMEGPAQNLARSLQRGLFELG